MSRYISGYVSSSSGKRKGEKTMVRVSSSVEFNTPTKRSRPSKTIHYIPVMMKKSVATGKKKTSSKRGRNSLGRKASRGSRTSRGRIRTANSRTYAFPIPGTITMSNYALWKSSAAKKKVSRQTMNVSVQPTVNPTPKVILKPTFKAAKTNNVRKNNLPSKLVVNISTHPTYKRSASPVYMETYSPHTKHICPRHQTRAYDVVKDSKRTTEPVVTVTSKTPATITTNPRTAVTTVTPPSTTVTTRTPTTVTTRTPTAVTTRTPTTVTTRTPTTVTTKTPTTIITNSPTSTTIITKIPTAAFNKIPAMVTTTSATPKTVTVKPRNETFRRNDQRYVVNVNSSTSLV